MEAAPHSVAENFQTFLGDDEEVLIFVHNTSSEELARKIMKEGFRYVNHLTYSSDQVSPKDEVQLRYFHILRRSYGDFTIALGIGKGLVNDYSRRLQGTPYHFSEVVALHSYERNEDGEPVYTLPPHFVKGFFNQQTGRGVINPGFDPHQRIPDFEKNLHMMLKGEWPSGARH